MGSDGDRRHGTYSRKGRPQLSEAMCDATGRMVAMLSRIVERVNRSGRGLEMNVSMSGPGEGRIHFSLQRHPEGRVSGQVNGGMVTMHGIDYAARDEFQRMVRDVLHDLSLKRFDERNPSVQPPGNQIAPAADPEQDKVPRTVLVPVLRPTPFGGMGSVREVVID